ncbi:MAG: hypothetical protein QCI82_02550 [Candidatus Thermoplasmatota archaeon]|nr:hypothetical protein [Candidatus Thermoplasmatota archaeon]
MARRRTVKDEEGPKAEEPLFKMPEFDETEFLQTENRNAKMIYITLGMALLAGIISFIIMRIAHYLKLELFMIIPIAAPILLAGGVFFLFFKFGIDVSSLDWKKWLENGAMYVITWGAVWILSMNPPFSDLSEPVISDPVLFVVDIDGVPVTHLNQTPSVVRDVKELSYFFLITDNSGSYDARIEVYILEGERRNNIDDTSGIKVTKIAVADNRTFNITSKDSDIIDMKNGWYGSDFERWEGNLQMIRISNITASTADIDLLIIVTVSDPSGNEAKREFRLDLKNR